MQKAIDFYVPLLETPQPKLPWNRAIFLSSFFFFFFLDFFIFWYWEYVHLCLGREDYAHGFRKIIYYFTSAVICYIFSLVGIYLPM